MEGVAYWRVMPAGLRSRQPVCRSFLGISISGTSRVLGDLASRLSLLPSIFTVGGKERIPPNPEKDSFPLRNTRLYPRSHLLGRNHGFQGDMDVMLMFPVLLGPT